MMYGIYQLQCVWLMGAHLTRVEWKSTTGVPGVRYVAIDGVWRRPTLSVDSWATLLHLIPGDMTTLLKVLDLLSLKTSIVMEMSPALISVTTDDLLRTAVTMATPV